MSAANPYFSAYGQPTNFLYNIRRGAVVLSGSTDAIPLNGGYEIIVTSTGVDAMTLVTPVSGGPLGTPGSVTELPGNNQLELLILSTTPHAHTVTVATNKFNGSTHIATFSGTLPNFLQIIAYNGVWYTLGSAGVTLS